MKKITAFFLSLLMIFSSAYLMAVSAAAADKVVLNVYNWGEYIDQKTITMFEEENPDIKVNYTTYDSNEAMYSKIVSGAADYDVIVPSDYMVSKLISENRLAKLNFENIPNYKYIGEAYKNISYDPNNEYTVPNFWGTVVIIYNSEFVAPEDIEKQSIELLWDAKYAGKILMFDNPRDAFGLSLISLGYSMNSENEEEWQAAAEKLAMQKPLVQAYVMDAIFDKMGAGEAWIAPYYAGDALIIQQDNPAIDFYIPKEGTNLFFDAMCILETSEHKTEAERYINFMCKPEIAAMNAEAVGYATPNTEAAKLLDSEITSNPLVYPNGEFIKEHTEVFLNLPQSIQSLQSKLWTDLKIISAEEDENTARAATWVDWFCIAVIGGGVGCGIYFTVRNRRRKKLWTKEM